jgi:hypothetical protein
MELLFTAKTVDKSDVSVLSMLGYPGILFSQQTVLLLTQTNFQ